MAKMHPFRAKGSYPPPGVGPHRDVAGLADRELAAGPAVSIGGAGTFDGVLLTGIVAVLLAGLL